MMPPGTRSARRARCSPTRRLSASDSSTQGPAMRNSASVGNRAVTASIRRFDERALAGAPAAESIRLRGGGDEASEERVRARGTRLQFRVELTANEPGMAWQLDDLDELTVR